MQRRSFLKVTAAAAPVLALPDILRSEALAQAPAPSHSLDLHVVGAAEDRSGHLHSLGISTLLFKVATQDAAGNLFVIEHKDLVPGGPALHLHWNQDEWFYVMEGNVIFQVGDQRVTLHPGESVLAPRRIPHTFSAVGATPAHLLIAFSPAGKMEAYFNDAPHQPADVTPAEFFRRYEMDYVGPSPFWKS